MDRAPTHHTHTFTQYRQCHVFTTSKAQKHHANLRTQSFFDSLNLYDSFRLKYFDPVVTDTGTFLIKLIKLLTITQMLHMFMYEILLFYCFVPFAIKTLIYRDCKCRQKKVFLLHCLTVILPSKKDRFLRKFNQITP